MQNALISVENLSYGFGPNKLPAYADVHFSLHGGELMCLAGVNGSGKSTLLRTLAGLYPPTSGTIHVRGKQLSLKKGESGLSELSALVVQEANMQILGSTLAEDIELTIKAETSLQQNRPAKSEKELKEKAHTLLAFLHLDHKLDWPVNTLSYGEKRKLCLVTAFLREPALFLLDEPFSGLDYPACLEVLAYMAFLLQQKTTIILSTHDTDLIFEQTDKFLFLSPFKAPFYGTAHDAANQYDAYCLKPLKRHLRK